MSKYLNIIFYQAPSCLAKSLYDSDEIKNYEIIKHINNGLTELRNSINSKGIHEKDKSKNE